MFQSLSLSLLLFFCGQSLSFSRHGYSIANGTRNKLRELQTYNGLFLLNSSTLGLEMSNLREDMAKLPVCPKPRRIRSLVPDFIEPLAYNCSHSKGKGGRSSEVIEMISSKADNGQEPSSNGCSPSYHCGSPPRRTNNPLVHDVQFIHQMELLSPFTIYKNQVIR